MYRCVKERSIVEKLEKLFRTIFATLRPKPCSRSTGQDDQMRGRLEAFCWQINRIGKIIIFLKHFFVYFAYFVIDNNDFLPRNTRYVKGAEYQSHASGLRLPPLNDSSVPSVRRHVVRLVKQPEPFPFILNLPQVLRGIDQLLITSCRVSRVDRQ